MTKEPKGNEQSDRYHCRVCNLDFEKPSALYWHRRREHSNVCFYLPEPFLT